MIVADILISVGSIKLYQTIWEWVKTPIVINCSGMNIHSPAILGFTQYTGFDP